LQVSRSLLDCAYASGLLSQSERASLALRLDNDASDALPLAEYRSAVNRLKRAPGWAVGTIRYTFAEALLKYSALDPRSARFSDDLLRSSPMWMLGDTLKVLAKDVDMLSGSVVEMNAQPVASAVALNGGIAHGTLRIFETIEDVDAATLDNTDVVVLPETIAELSPVAGILTLGEGNALSHVQLLARNFGIPNVAIQQDTVDLLRDLENSEVMLVVDSDGNVILRKFDTQAAALLDAGKGRPPDAPVQIEVPVPDLAFARVLPLSEIGREQSGRIIGPKAANLGELNRLFPGRVAPAVAIPFGIYAEHLQAAGLIEKISDVFAANAAGEIDKAEFDAVLADVRRQITALTLSPQTRAELAAVMFHEFGEPGSYGVFVRSDTNVEDLPQFTGAGLNETIPNVVGLDAQLTAVPRVWSSVFSPRALAWRSSVLKNPAQIYASVLLMKSVPATKSGVLVTTNLFDRAATALTASAAWGVGGAVAGEPAESIVIYANGIEVVSEAKSPYQRSVAASGGVAWIPAKAGPVLEPAEIDALRRLAREVNEKYVPVFDEAGRARPWDIEFGFVDGELTLFQIRPLVDRATNNAAAILRLLKPDIVTGADPALMVALDQLPGS
jgi:phosphoenolpyruvate synthase/pyruvate phosphate dikinase